MIPNIKITSSTNKDYKVGQIICADRLYSAFANARESDWLERIPMPTAIDYMSEKLGIKYEIA